MRLKYPSELPNIAKFSDEIPWSTAVHPIKMYVKEEELLSDEAESDAEMTEFRRNKKKKRSSYYKTRSSLVLEDSSRKANGEVSSGLNFVGNLSNESFVDLESTLIEKRKAVDREEPAAFRYVLIQFMKNENEVNVIPVGNMYEFRKIGEVQDQLMNEIDAKIDEKIRQDKEKSLRYKNIMCVLDNIEKKNKQSANSGDAQSAGFDAPLFGSQARTGFSKRTNKMAQKHFLDDSGADLEDISGKNEAWSGDFSTRCADDEEDHVHYEQADLDLSTDREITRSVRYSEHVDSSDEDEEDDDEDESEEETEEASGMLTKEMTQSAKDAIRELSRTQLKSAMKKSRDSSVSIGVEAGNGNKRGRAEGCSEKRVTIVAEGESAPSISVKKESASDGNELSLTERSIVDYIRNRGGVVKAMELVQVTVSQF